MRSFRKQLQAVSHGCRQRCRRRHRQCPPPEGATTQTVPSARTSERRDGPVRVLEGSEEGQGRGGGTSSTTRPCSGSASPRVPGHCLGEPRGPQERIQQRTKEQLADVVLCAADGRPVAGHHALLRHASACPRQVFEVSKILLDNVEMTFQFLVVEGESLVFKVFLLNTVQQRCILLRNVFLRIVQQIVDIPVSGGGLQDFRPGQSSSSSSHVPARVHEDADEPGEGGPMYPVTLDDLSAGSDLGIGAFFDAATGVHRRLSDFVHQVVVHRRDAAVRGWLNWIREDPLVHPYRWLRPDLVPPAPFLQCEPHLTPDGSGILSNPNQVYAEFRKAWLPYFLPLWAKGDQP